jgi:4-amino-4-deoxy-L-arabinose transferase-like glycosyltransferase
MSLLVLRLPPQRDEARTGYHSLHVLVRPFAPARILSTAWQMRPLTAIFAVAALALPWFLAVGLATEGEFWRQYFWGDNLGVTAQFSHEPLGSVWSFPVAILLGFFPWSLFVIPLAIDLGLQLRGREAPNPGFTLAASWFLAPLLILALAQSKQAGNLTSCFPALALLTGSYVDRASRGASVVAGRWLLAAFGGLAAVGAGVMVAVPLVVPQYLPGEEMLGLIGLTPFGGGIICLGLALVRNYRAAAGVFGASATVLATLLYGLASQQADRHQPNHLVLQTVYSQSAAPSVASFDDPPPSWVYYCGPRITRLRSSPDGHRSGMLTQQFLNEGPDRFVVTTRGHLRQLESHLSPDIAVLAQTNASAADETMVVLGRQNDQVGRTTSLESAISSSRGFR